MCILHHQGRFLHNQRETHSHLSTRPLWHLPPDPNDKRPQIPSSQPSVPYSDLKESALTSLHQTSDTFLANQKVGQTPPCAFLTTKDVIKHRRDTERDEGPKGIQKALFPQTKASPLLFFSSGIRQKSAPSRTSSSRNSTTTTTARCPCRPLARVLAPVRPNLPARPLAPCSANHHHQHHNGRHRVVSPRPSGCHDVCIPCLDYLLSATSNKELTAWHCAWSSPPRPPIIGTRMSARPVSFPPFSCCLFLLSFLTHLRLPFPLPFTFCYHLFTFQPPLCLHSPFLSLPQSNVQS